MKLAPALRAWMAAGWAQRAVYALWVLLAGWAVGIAIGAWQLDAWRQDLTRTLMQLNADAQFRARAHHREAVDPEWYRRKALALLSATGRLQEDAAWTVFIPGSWRSFDKLEEQLQARLEREFNDIVVETVRRELYARASQLTGVALVRGTGDLQAGMECQSPVPQAVERRLTAAAEDLPEFVAVKEYVLEVERLDRAVQSFFSLQYSGGGNPEQLRQLVAYTLQKELPGALAGSVRMFQANEEVNIQPALMQSRLQWAARCSLGKAMSSLHTRLLNTNDLFALEQGYVERSHGLFDGPVRHATFDRTLERYRAVYALLEDQHKMLAKGRNDWMGQAKLQLGPAYEDVMKRIEHTRLLGPEVVQQLHNQSGSAFAEFRRQFEEVFRNRGEPGVVWIDAEQRFGLSAQRAAMRQGLGALLKTSFMSDEAPRPPAKNNRENTSLAKVAQEARALAEERARAIAEIVPVFPPQAQPVVARVVDARVSELIYQRAFRTLKAGLPEDPQAPLDPNVFRQQRDQVLALQAVLKQCGGAWLGERLVATLDAEVLRRLAGIQDEWKRLPINEARVTEFAWWQGEPFALAQAMGAAEPGAPQVSLGRSAARLEVLVQQARPLLALGSPALANDPSAQRWLHVQAELERYKARAQDSSLLRLERWLAAMGPDLRRENCTERLVAHVPSPIPGDEIAQRHMQLHNALATRCNELRQAGSPAASLTQ
ncbi:MAG TPA: hypothetical protein VF522_03150 [Ramlibacter sp.]|uniref:hypothetical protein n=1 Tax=Ramlibacter sp. TaxID=1917967 RepID=UPI002ED3332D